MDIKFSDNWTDILDAAEIEGGVPRFRWTNKGRSNDPFPKGTRIKKFGLTPEEELMKIAPEGTKPERLLYGWLVTHDIPFSYQEPYLGGRVPGGAIIDFVIFEKHPPIVIRIMSYWHKSPSMQWRDSIQYDALVNLGLYVVDLWEREINTIDKVEREMQKILFGYIESGGVLAISKTYDDYGTDCPFCDDPYCVPCKLPI